MKRLYKLLWWLNIGTVLVTSLSYLAPYINPQKIWQASFFGLAYPTLLWINIFFIGLWSLARKKYLLLSLFTILIGWSALSSYVGFGLNPDEGHVHKDIRLLTYNTNALYHFRKEKNKPKRLAKEAKFQTFLLSQDANVICLQEFPRQGAALFQDSTSFGSYHQRITRTGSILSKWPILKSEDAFFPNSKNGYLWADIKTTTDTLRIFNIHLQSNSISKKADDVLSSDLQEQETWSKIRSVMDKVNESTLKRVDQAEFIAHKIASSPYPVIVAGDFNNTPQSYAYKLLSENLTDSFREKGFGIGTTYAGRIPGLRIDFILAEPSFKVLNSEVLKVNFSDHYPVVSTFSKQP